MPALPTVAILMCTYNGGSFLCEQLESFTRQTYPHWKLLVSDDGSKDKTLDILQHFHTRWGQERVRILSGPQQGYVKNFLSLTSRTDIEADYFAWSDQDDIWGEEKLQAAMAWLITIPLKKPALYCGRTQLISECGEPIGYSPHFSRSPHFNNALVQNIGGGNTMVFNLAARQLLQMTNTAQTIPSHDWWAYILVTGVGGAVHYDSTPYLLYRQHGGNLVGSNSSWRARLYRIRMLFHGRFKEWNTQNIHALQGIREHLNKDNQATLALFTRFRRQILPLRVINFFRSHLYRQTLLGNLGLIVATLFKKL
ncbi:glycosyltransferase family 2 protein [Pseudomonas kairouanensis]|uniref:Glycosyltransferase family 2 protein n=1 Tax=Pseudomonas kairouanensis TaxID=2293832 RepID=A0A4Z0ATI0_9PSED|nr:glycosyltransferase family 2 protein [Pseudomonas kairouanensis]TFY90132.1 glycosyltransferase family 2 protein [Pseudomonas kairouanensis]